MTEDMIIFALRSGDACVAIYRDFDQSEITDQSPSIQQAWGIGKLIVAYMENNP